MYLEKPKRSIIWNGGEYNLPSRHSSAQAIALNPCCCTHMIIFQLNNSKVMPSAGFLEVALAAVLESPECIPNGSPGVARIQILARCGEGLLSNVLYALLGVSALSRVSII